MQSIVTTVLPRDHPAPGAPSLLQHYEAIEQVSCRMLEAARAGDWQRVTELEDTCRLLISRLKQAATRPLSAEERKVKAGIMRRLLINDAQLRALAEPELDRLSRLVFGQPATTLH